MLRRLTIENYFLIDRAAIDFAAGATMFTGETGSGKTMVLGALECALGGRSGADVVGRAANRARVALEFDPDEALRARFLEDGFEIDGDEYATLEREIAQGGKSSLRLNGRGVTAAYIRELAHDIAEMVGQHEAQRLLSPAYHLQLLDAFAGEDTLAQRQSVREEYDRLQSASQALQALESDERRAQEQFEFARFALDEIGAAALTPGEDDPLAQRRKILENSGKISTALASAHEALSGDEGAAADALGAAQIALDGIAPIGSQFAAMSAQVQALQSEVNDLAASITREAESMEFDPRELDTINARLEIIDGLKRKHGGSIESVLAAAESFAATVDAFENKDERRRQLREHVQHHTDALREAAAQLSVMRAKAAAALKQNVEKELRDLAFGSARFEAGITPLEQPGRSGADSVEFLFAANKGEELRKLGRAASGGELSRVLLALVVALARSRGTTALIFDEIDAGVGGATATAVGARLARLAESAQVICVTHLAQIASWAHMHYALEKHEGRGGTTISVRAIDSKSERANEIARMLSGETHDAALKHARLLLSAATMQ